MALPKSLKDKMYSYCNNHLPSEGWYDGEFAFIEDEKIRKRIVEEFKGVRFAYKLYVGLEATEENLIFEVRHQILAYASIYEAIIHYVLYEYYKDTEEFHKMLYHTVPTKMSFCKNKWMRLRRYCLGRMSKFIFTMIKSEKRMNRKFALMINVKLWSHWGC